MAKSLFLIDIVAALGEFVGTTMFLFFAFTGTAVAKIPAVEGSSDISIPAQTYIALCFGFSLMVNVWVFYRVSGGLFNPAVSDDLITLITSTGTRHAESLAVADRLIYLSSLGYPCARTHPRHHTSTQCIRTCCPVARWYCRSRLEHSLISYAH